MVSFLGDYFGSTLAGLITANKAAIGSQLGISQNDVLNPDILLAAILLRVRAWLEADGTADNFSEVLALGANGHPSKHFGAAARSDQIGYRYWAILWQWDVNPDDIISLTIYAWVEISGIWQQVGNLIDSPGDDRLLTISNGFDPTGKTIVFEGYYTTKPVIEMRPLALTFSGVLFEGYYATLPIVEVI